jgi:hypothetical protein
MNRKEIQVNQVREIDSTKMEIIISGIYGYSTSEIREIIENAFDIAGPPESSLYGYGRR